MMRFFLFVLFVFCLSTSVSADYCSDDRWWENQLKQDEFSRNWRRCYANYETQVDNFRTLQLLNRQYSIREVEIICRDNPDNCQKMFYFLCKQEVPLLQHIEKVLKKIKTENKESTSPEKP